MKSINLNTRMLKKYKMKLFNELAKLVWKDNTINSITYQKS